MKTSTIPSVRVEPALREQIERVLAENESLSQFVETSVRDTVMRRLAQAEFIARGMTALATAKHDGSYVAAETVLRKLEARLTTARAAKASKTSAAR